MWDRLDRAALDRHITGNYGEDYFKQRGVKTGKHCDVCDGELLEDEAGIYCPQCEDEDFGLEPPTYPKCD